MDYCFEEVVVGAVVVAAEVAAEVAGTVDSSHFDCFGLNRSTQFGGSILYYII